MIDNHLAPYGAFLLRAVSGSFFLIHAGLKLFVYTPAGTVQFFQSVGLPGPLAYLAIAAEVLGGISLLVGVFVRQAAVALALLLLGTIVTVHGPNGFFFDAPKGGWEYPAFWAVALVAQALIGEGAFALGNRAASAN